MSHSETEFEQDNAFDPRVAANAIIGRANSEGLPVTQIALQKLMYFAHGLFLLRHRKPLVSGYFEAWTYGPVHPAVYAAFKASGSDPIKSKAYRKDLRTGELHELPGLNDPFAPRVINFASLIAIVAAIIFFMLFVAQGSAMPSFNSPPTT